MSFTIFFAAPTHIVARIAARFDKRWIDGFIDGLAVVTRGFANAWDTIADRGIVDGFVNLFASWMYALGVWLRIIQTGHLHQYVVFIVIGTISLFVLISFFWNPTLAG